MYGGEARAELGVGSFAPSHGLPDLGRQRLGQGLGGDRLVVGVSAHPGGRPALATPGLGRQRAFARTPDAERWLHAHDIGQIELSQAGAEAAVRAITGVGQDTPGAMP